ncbi:MAG: sigma-70 family RNA polymerase sigma factor [Planctomycetota bacterium]
MVEPQQNATADPAHWLDEHGSTLYRYAVSRLRDPEAAEEVVQETFVAALRNLDQFSGRGSEGAWLLGILKRKVIDHIRVRNRALSGSDSESPDELSERLFDTQGHWRNDPRIFGDDPSAGVTAEDFWKILQGCLQHLPTKQADVFTLREVEGKQSEEICREIEISASNLWVLLHRARLRLADCMRSKWQMN